MARTVRDAKLETRAARNRLPLGEHFRTLVPGRLHLGYIKRRKDAPGRWFLREHLGAAATGKNPYRKATIGLADDYRDADGVDVFAFAEAQRLAHEKHEAPRREASRPVTVADVIAAYIEGLEARPTPTVSRRRTVAGAHSRAKLHILPQLGAIKVADLTLAGLERWRDDVASSRPFVGRRKAQADATFRTHPGDEGDALRARKSSTNKVLSDLKAAMQVAVDANRIPDDPRAPWRKLKKFGAEEVRAPRSAVLSVAEAGRLVAAADDALGFRALVRAALETGCRYGELAGLRVGDVLGRQVHVRHSKSGKARYVRLTDDGADFFAALAADRPSGDVLLQRKGARPWRQSEQQRPMMAACAAASLPNINFHQLRHTWATLALERGMALDIVAKNLGHRDTTMVQHHYAHLSEEFVDAQIADFAPRYGFDGSNVVPLRREAAG